MFHAVVRQTPALLRALMRRWPLPLLIPLLMVLLSALAACSSPASPAFPPVSPPLRYAAAVPPDPQALAAPVPAAPEAWWQLFEDAPLDALVQQALRDNPGVQQAAARAERAAAVLDAQAAAGRPQVQLGAGVTRQVGPLQNAAGAQGNLFAAELRAQLDVDLAGRGERGRAAAAQDWLAQQALDRHARLLLQADVARLELSRRALALEQAHQAQAVAAARQALQAADALLQAGLAPATLRDTLAITLQGDAAEAARLARQQAQLGHALAALLGREEPPALAPGSALPALPAVPAGLPSQMLQRRADVAAAGAALQAARLRLGLAQDAWWPQLSLTAQAGLASAELGLWLRAAARQAGLGVLLALPVFDGGRRAAAQAQAAADVQLAAAAHRESVVEALRDVNDQLAALQTLAVESAARDAAAAAAQAAAGRAASLRQRGLLAAAQPLQAERAALQAQRLAVQAHLARQLATVALVRALGGGWGPAPAGPVALAPTH